MANEKFYLIFGQDQFNNLLIDEPINYSEVDFNIDQQDDGWGRDVTLSGGEVKFKFTNQRYHYLKELLRYNNTYGFEADVKLKIVLSSGMEFLGELDFATAETDGYTYFECSVLLDSQFQLFKRRSDVKVDLFSNKDIDGNEIEPLQPINMLLQAKPVSQASKWNQPADFYRNLNSVGNSSRRWYQINPIQNLLSSEIKNSYTNFEIVTRHDTIPEYNDKDYQLILAQSNLRDVKLSFKGLKIDFTTDVDNGGNGYCNLKLKIYKGATLNTSTSYTLLEVYREDHQSYTYDGDIIDFSIGNVQRGEFVWFFYELEVRQSANVTIGLEPSFEVFMNMGTGATLDVTAESVAYNSVSYSFRLIDAMKQIAKSISNTTINAPRYDIGGEFYDNVIVNGNLLRNINNKPFYVSWDDIEKSIVPEHNAGKQIERDGSVTVGIYKDFFTNNECGSFDQMQYSDFKKKQNPIYSINTFSLKYSKFQALKENTEANSESTVHGETSFTLFNKKVENSKSSSIQWIRDAIMLDVQQRASTVVDSTTSTQDDDNIFAIDTVVTTGDSVFTETTELKHTYTEAVIPFLPYLSLTSKGDVNFVVIGIRVGTIFTIMSPDSNAGDYQVISVDNTELKLFSLFTAPLSPANDGIRLTEYSYRIKASDIPLTNRTDEGFSNISNLMNKDKYSNLRYSIQRNIVNYWSSFLATANSYWKNNPLINTFYKNNGLMDTTYNGIKIIEKDDFTPSNPLVTPFMYEDVVISNQSFDDFIELRNNIMDNKGFIRSIDNNGEVFRIFPISVSYQSLGGQLRISGQEKAILDYINIVKTDNYIGINNGEYKGQVINFKRYGDYFILYDNQMIKLYNKKLFSYFVVNGYAPESANELETLLNLL